MEEWSFDGDPGEVLQRLSGSACRPEMVVIRFEETPSADQPITRRQLEEWLRSRPVTVGRVTAPLAGPALGFALCADMVYLEPEASLRLPPPGALPPPALIYAAGRAGSRAFRRVLLGTGEVPPDEAVALGLAQGVVEAGEPLPLPRDGSPAALTAARDLLRSGATGSGKLALELAAFQLLFAGGDPEEGARAFLERRPAAFGNED